MTYLLVGLGGALGSMARHGLNQLIHQRTLHSSFPLGIFLINVVGSVAIGAIAGAVASGRWQWPYEWRVFVVVGILGGFTTFSSFSLDTLTLMRGGHYWQAVWNAGGQVGLSLAGVWLAYRLNS